MISTLGLALIGITTAFTTLAPLITAVGAIIGAVSLPVLALIAVVGLLAYYVVTHWKEIKDGTQIVWDAIKSVVKSTIDYIVSIFTSMFDTVMGIINRITSAVRSVTGAISSVAGGIGHGVSTALSLVPHFASGGIVTGPTLALIGEAGPEAVVPLSGGRGAGMGGINVYIQGGTYLSESAAEEIGNKFIKKLKMSLAF